MGRVDVLAGEHDGGNVGQHRQDRVDIGRGERDGVDDRFGVEGADLVTVAGEVMAVGEEVCDRHPRIRDAAAPMHDQDLVSPLVQALDHSPTEKARPTDDQNTHRPSVAQRVGRTSVVGRPSGGVIHANRYGSYSAVRRGRGSVSARSPAMWPMSRREA